METNFILLIIFLMMTIYWFVNMSEVKMGSHKKAYGLGVLFVICACVSRIFCVYVDYNTDKMTVNAISIAHMVYLICLMIAYSSYGYLSLCLLNYNVRWKKIVLYVYFTPCIISVILMIISRFNGLIYTVTQVETGNGYINQYAHGPFHIIVSFIPVFYILPGLINMIKKRKYLPQNLIKCTVITMLGFLMGLAFIAVTGSKAILFGVIALVQMVQLFAILFYDKFWDEQSTSLNQQAFDFYMKRYLEKKKSMNIILLQIVGFGYYKESKEKDTVALMLNGIVDDLKTMIAVNTIYYLGKGSFVIAVDEDEKHVDEDDFIRKLTEYCNNPTNAVVRQLSPDFDISYIRVPEDVDDPKVLYSFISMEKNTIEVREEKVRFREKNDLHLAEAYRVDKVLKSIQKAIQNQSFQMYYQPIYNVKEKKFTSAEALIRLIDDEMGFIPPDEFIPLAEKNGMIMDIGSQVFDSVCRFIDEAQLSKKGIAYIEVNVSIGQFLDDSLSHKLEKAMKKHHVSYDQINLEITETATPFEENKMRAQLKRMSDMGFMFSLDDYGTGYSNMEAVTEYPLEIIKLDKSIVWSAFSDNKAMVTMESLVSMFHNLGFKIVAEGVEDENMLKQLEKIQVDYIQGYYFSKPLPEADFLAYLKNVQLKSDQ